MLSVKTETRPAGAAKPGDDGDPHLPEGGPAAGVGMRQRFRPNMHERLAILGGAEIELIWEAGAVRLAVISR